MNLVDGRRRMGTCKDDCGSVCVWAPLHQSCTLEPRTPTDPTPSPLLGTACEDGRSDLSVGTILRFLGLSVSTSKELASESKPNSKPGDGAAWRAPIRILRPVTFRLTTDPARLEWTYTLPNSRLAGSSCRQSFSVDANSSTNLEMCFGDLEGALCKPHFSETADLSRWESYFGNNVLRAQYARKGDAELVWNALFRGHCMCWLACNA